MRKIFTFLFAALMSVGMYATTEVTITDSDFPSWGDSFTKDGVTVSAEMIDGIMYGNISGPGSFSTTLGNFTKIEVNANYVDIAGEGWSGDSERQTWTGNASSVSFSGDIMGNGQGVTLIFTIEESTVAVTGVTLNQNEAQMTVGGETLTLTATVNPNNATDQSVSWSTSDANVATVENGVVTAVAAGNATITVTTTDGSFTATCAVTVSNPAPAEVTVVFAANNKTVERTVTLPHTFKCSWDNGMDGPDELDIIIHELYNDYYYCNSNMNASGSDQVEVGTEEAPKNDYITIKGVFEGTATVTGDYFDWITGEEGAHNYSITISIKGGSATAVENVQTNQVQGSKILRDGQLLIEKNGKIYNVMGAEVREA